MWDCRASSVLIYSLSHVLLALAKAKIEMDTYKMMNCSRQDKMCKVPMLQSNRIFQ